ncbi:MAG: FAD-binding oxidoreductase [Proteobacteria bacterium]|jgi:FAD/FMN-containing dehydrogenase|nr:FAD-binding oxidoreductase [Pseudomonadota bacterium]
MLNFVEKLYSILDASCIIVDTKLKVSHETDWRNKYFCESLAVVFPKSTKEIQQIILLCNKYQIKITPQGGNTSTCGASVPTNNLGAHIILNLSKLNKIIELDIDNLSITLESGCLLQQVIDEANKINLYFPLKIASSGICQIGGNIATNAGGIHVVKYGTMRDLTLGLEVILPNGEIINQLHKLRKNNTNFDLKQLFIGSEGTLGIITKATLKLFSKPLDFFTLMFGVSTIENAINLLSEFKLNGIIPSAFEIINKHTQKVYNDNFLDNQLPIQDEWIILCEVECNEPFNNDKITDILETFGIDFNKVVIASNETERKNLWSIREHIPIAEKTSGFALKYDISLPISNIPKFIQTNSGNLSSLDINLNIIIFGHLGDGNLHYNIPLTNKIKPDYEDKISNIVYSDVVLLDGSISAEHGIGQLKKEWFKKFYDSSSYILAKSIKHLIDPDDIFNPGKIF